MVADSTERGGGAAPKHRVFLSYRSVDNTPPPDSPKAKGFVSHFSTQLAYELSQLGWPGGITWMDRAKLAPGDVWDEAIRKAVAESDIFLAVLSRNYVGEHWCKPELDTFKETIKGQPEEKRIFRIDKHGVRDDDLPPPLHRLQATKFYARDTESDREIDYFYRGKVVQRDAYLKAIREVAEAIHKRLCELQGRPSRESPPPPPRRLLEPASVSSNGRTVFVACAASDLRDHQRSLIRELRGRGYEVATVDEALLMDSAATVMAAIEQGLSRAEVSIHLVGNKKGPKPDGLSHRIVPLQLSEAAKLAEKRPGFERLIWAPRIVPGCPLDERGPRDPLATVAELDPLRRIDQVDGDTAAHFCEFVLQHLQNRGQREVRPAAKRLSVYVAALANDRRLLPSVTPQVQALGAKAIQAPLAPEGRTRQAMEALINGADHAVFCWGDADEVAMLETMAAQSFLNWQGSRPAAATVVLCLGPLDEAKSLACETNAFGTADLVLNGNDPAWPRRLAALLGIDRGTAG